MWSHFDAGSCPGSAVGVRVRLENGLGGFIHTKNLSDKEVKNPEERVRVGMTLHARILKIDIEHFRVDLTSRTSDLLDTEDRLRYIPCVCLLIFHVSQPKFIANCCFHQSMILCRFSSVAYCIFHSSFVG